MIGTLKLQKLNIILLHTKLLIEIILKSVINKTKSFKCLDGQIYYLPKTKKFKNIRQLKKDLSNLLSHRKRIVRKTICNFISANHSDCYFETKKLWPNDVVVDKKISLLEFNMILFKGIPAFI